MEGKEKLKQGAVTKLSLSGDAFPGLGSWPGGLCPVVAQGMLSGERWSWLWIPLLSPNITLAMAPVLVSLACHNKNIIDWMTETTEIYFLTVLVAEKCKIKVLGDSVPDQSSLLACRRTLSCCVTPW